MRLTQLKPTLMSSYKLTWTTQNCQIPQKRQIPKNVKIMLATVHIYEVDTLGGPVQNCNEYLFILPNLHNIANQIGDLQDDTTNGYLVIL